MAAAVVAVLLACLGTGRLAGGGRSTASAAAPAQQIGMKVLLITDNNTDPSNASDVAYGDWVNTLTREGVPYDTWVTSSPMPALSSTGADGTQIANYEGVVVATSGLQGMTSAQWAALQTFEHQFSVRQVTAYASPSADQGLNAASSTDFLASTTPISLTGDGSQAFPYLKGVALDTGSFGYEATTAAGANVDPLITGPNASVVLGVYTAPDGRQTMFQTFNENPYMLQSQLLRHGELDWLARNTYFGDQRNYLETHIDDNFLADAAWSIAGNATTAPHTTDFNDADSLRTVPADVAAAAAWSRQNNFRIDMLFNGGGSVAVASGDTLVGAGDSGSGGVGSTGTTGGSSTCSSASPCPDPLLAAFQTTDPATGKAYTDDFAWISHTWDHPNVDQGCATQNYIEAELNQNTQWATKAAAATPGNPIDGGLGLTSSTDPTATLGTDDPQVIITGEHSGLANLLPGNPGQVDPPSLDEAVAATTAGTLPAGTYEYAVTDQFNTAPPGQTPVAGAGESAASVSAPVVLTAPGEVSLTWGAVCHAGRYNIYRAPYSGTAPGAWSLLGTVDANTTTDFLNPTSTTNTAGGGAGVKTYTDTGAAGTATGSTGALTATSRPSTEGAAIESAYEQNPVLDAAFAATLGGGIKYFGADASKPYPSPADGTFATGSYTGMKYANGTSFPDAGATGIPRYPTNVYYNVSTNAQEVDEYQTLYDSPTCIPVTGVTTCNPAGTAFTIGQIMTSADQGMFQHMMGNDPKPTYFHQTNLMSQPTGTVNNVGDGLYYEAMNPLLAQYHQYFQANTPIMQLTMPEIATLLNEQSGWAAADTSQITGSISGNVVTVRNTGAATNMPLTGTTVGSAYAGTQSGWTSAPNGTSTYTALAAWPAPPTTPVIIQPIVGSAPGTAAVKLPAPVKPPATPGGPRSAAPVGSQCIQVPPATVALARGSKATAYLKCKAALGSSFARGTLSVTLKGQTVRKSFRIATRKIGRVTFTLPKRARTAATGRKHPTLHAKLKISTNQAHGRALITRGNLNIRTAPKKHAKKKTRPKHKKHHAVTHT
jgi:hypothetical protein